MVRLEEIHSGRGRLLDPLPLVAVDHLIVAPGDSLIHLLIPATLQFLQLATFCQFLAFAEVSNLTQYFF